MRTTISRAATELLDEEDRDERTLVSRRVRAPGYDPGALQTQLRSCTNEYIGRRPKPQPGGCVRVSGARVEHHPCTCLLYTSDAADDLLCVDLGGRRIIKKKKQQKKR